MAFAMVASTVDRVIGKRSRVCGAVFGLLLSGCAAARPLVAPAGDYAAYRSTRVAKTPGEQLAAAARYLKLYPDGMFASDVSVYFARTEPVFYAAQQRTEAGLSAYLNALPHGPHAQEAVEQLRALVARRSRPDALVRAAAASGAQLDQRAAERLAVRKQMSLWIGRFLDLAVWRQPLTEAPADVVVAWTLGLPNPTCTPEPASTRLTGSNPSGELLRCSKRLELPYFVFVDARSVPRNATIDLTLLQDAAGQVHQMALAGPDLFTRIEETFAARPIAPNDTASRINAISRVAELVHREFAQKVSDKDSCQRLVVAPVVLDLACGGLRVVVTAGLDGSEPDRVTLTRFEG